jgi:hypothetical protein
MQYLVNKVNHSCPVELSSDLLFEIQRSLVVHYAVTVPMLGDQVCIHMLVDFVVVQPHRYNL